MIGPDAGPVHYVRIVSGGACVATRCNPGPKPAGPMGTYTRAQENAARATTRATVWEPEVTCPPCTLPPRSEP